MHLHSWSANRHLTAEEEKSLESDTNFSVICVLRYIEKTADSSCRGPGRLKKREKTHGEDIWIFILEDYSILLGSS
ncbi:hypothetical protein CHARACLAT_025834 [Characodon lateralis]|uniref:Uncharacterized protein n=1 Tax=Characodon lateralis TaxID=208331 RepID=A0ABU7F6H8_9TELE|nr:hypothetical protein [Characodon lateralis]